MNEREIRRTFELMKKENDIIEIRFFQGVKTFSGYFDNVDTLVKDLLHYGNENIYFVMNEIKQECVSRIQYNRIQNVDKKMYTTSDKDIEFRTWILIDVDGKRSTGISASDAEKKESAKVANAIYSYLRDTGFPEPISTDSGNGYHLLYKIELPNDEESKNLIDKFLKSLDVMFSNEHAEVDKSVFNAGRITKMYGTFARKGLSTEDRPHRISRILRTPEIIKPTPIELIRKVANLLPEPERPTYSNNYGKESFDLEQFMASNGIKYTSKTNVGGGTKYILEHCCFDHNHKGKDAAIFQMANGAIGYKCLHNSCSQYKWQDVRKLFDPKAYDQKNSYVAPNRVTKPKTAQPTTDEKGGKFMNLSEIRKISRDEIVSIPSGIVSLDRKIIGFNKGELSIWSGNNASGKSTLLGQICLNAVERGFKAILFSGELTGNRVKDWIHLQAAGRQYTKPSDYSNMYYVPHITGNRIDTWLTDKLYVYNNKYGNEFQQLLADIKDAVINKGVDMVVLDNLMAMDLFELSEQEYKQQTKAILALSDFVKEHNIHIHMVAHPRKATGFLRKIDIAGTGNLGNAADNIFIVHRVNTDFLKAVADFYGKTAPGIYVEYSNVIEVCKNRDLGVIDELIGTYFEIESKRFLNERSENPNYSWQELNQQTEIKPNTSFETQTDQFGNTDCPY